MLPSSDEEGRRPWRGVVLNRKCINSREGLQPRPSDSGEKCALGISRRHRDYHRRKFFAAARSLGPRQSGTIGAKPPRHTRNLRERLEEE